MDMMTESAGERGCGFHDGGSSYRQAEWNKADRP